MEEVFFGISELALSRLTCGVGGKVACLGCEDFCSDGSGAADCEVVIQVSSSSRKKMTRRPTRRGLIRPIDTQLRRVPSVTLRYLAASIVQ